MPAMAKRKQGASRNPPNRSGEPLNVWLPAELLEALRAYLASTAPRVSKTAAVEMAMQDFLRTKGFWPPPDSK